MTTDMNLGDVRVVDPILSNVVQGYRHPGHVGRTLFPRVPVNARGGSIIAFGRESFRQYHLRRAPGSATVRVQFGYEGQPFRLVQESLEVKVPFEHMQDASQVPGIDLASRAMNTNMRIVDLQLEIQQGKLATDPDQYAAANKEALSGTDKWSDDESNPASQIDDYKETVRQKIGIDPNTLVLSGQAFKAMRNNPNVIERFKYTGRDSITAEMIAAMLDLERVVVGKAIYLPDDAANPVDVWGNNAILAYAPEAPSSQEEPSFGYTYTLDGHPMVEEPYQDRNAKSWLYPVSYDREPVIAAPDAGFLIQAPA